MKLHVHRDTFTELTTIGKLHVNGVEYCETLEDKDRRLESGGTKVYGKTCIPRGTYEVGFTYWKKYDKHMPHILNVPQFTGIFIHPGNYDKDTEGCLLVGRTRGVDFIGDSRTTFDNLLKELEHAVVAGESIEITFT